MSTRTLTATNINYGAAGVTFNSVELGYFKDAVTFRYDITYFEQTSSQSSMIIDKKIISERAIATVAMLETELDKLTSVMNTGTYVLDSGATKKKIQFGGHQIAVGDALTLVITPLADAAGTETSDSNEKITIYKAFPEVKINYSFSLEDGSWVVPVEFHAIKDSTKTTGNQLFLLGDSTATA